MLPAKYDIIVAGAGASGVSAAVAAARHGKKVLIIERYGFTGGTATAGLVHHWDPVRLIGAGGIAMEFYDRLKAEGALIDFEKPEPEMPFAYWEGGCGFDPETFKEVCLDMLEEAGVTCLFHSLLTGVEMRNGRLLGVKVHNKSGEQVYGGQLFIDCTGDGELLHLAGCECDVGDEEGTCMAPTLAFRVGGVDTEQIYAYFDRRPDQFGNHPRLGKYIKNYRESVTLQGFYELLEEAAGAGDLTMPVPESGLGITLQPRYGEFHVNGTRTPGKNPLNGEDVSALEIAERRHVRELFAFMRNYIPGCANAYILQTADQVGIRESRRLVGNYVLTEEDIRNGTCFEDRVVRSKWAHFDVHSGTSMQWSFEFVEGPYYIPYRSLITDRVVNLAAAGRCISCTRTAMASIRIIPIGAMTGQAAGTACALALDEQPDGPPELGRVDTDRLIRLLGEDGAAL